ncbi:Protein tyrosine phosphatase type IVA 1 [Rhizophlyctis rosea]|nr:Protein tyrosine phosphatase type IVA 1 [Rhizophlyctis rosea]
MPARIPFSRIMSDVEFRNLRFVILDCPTEENLDLYIEELKTRQVTDVVRLCEPTYDSVRLTSQGIGCHDWPFKDGGVPPPQILQSFLSLCDDRFAGIGSKDTPDGPAIAVHCVAGLGRAPVLVAIALIEAGMTPLDAIDYIRRRRRGAFNSVQLTYLVDTYKRNWTKKSSTSARMSGINFLSTVRRSPTPESSAAGGNVGSGGAGRGGGCGDGGGWCRE